MDHDALQKRAQLVLAMPAAQTLGLRFDRLAPAVAGECVRIARIDHKGAGPAEDDLLAA